MNSMFASEGSFDCNSPVCGMGPVELVTADDDAGENEDDFDEKYRCVACGDEGTYQVRHKTTEDGNVIEVIENYTGILHET